MRFEDRLEKRPLEEDAKETQQPRPPASQLAYETLPEDLEAAARTDGPERVQWALDQLERGEARPEDLLAWIDDLREPEQEGEEHDDPEPAEGFMHDFEYDSEAGDSNMIDPDAVADAQQAAAPTESAFDDSADADYVFSAVKRRNLAGDDDEDAPDDPAPSDEKKAAPPAAKKSKKS